MKLLLVYLVVVGVQSSEVLNSFIEQGDAVWDLVRDVARDVLSEDGTDFQPHVRTVLSLVESQVCPDPEEGDQCDPGLNWLLGCSCKAEFAALEGGCSNTPCEMVRCMKDNGPQALSDFMSAASYEEMYGVVMEQVEKVLRALCECRGVVDASIGCVRYYDGKVFDLAGTDRSTFDFVVDHMDWETLGGILHGYLDAICGEENGDDCLTVFTTMLTRGGACLDNTLKGIDNCFSLLRVEKEVKGFLEAQVFEEGMNDKSYFYGILEAYLTMNDKAFCHADCAEKMQETFYSSCCVKRAGERLSSKSMKKKYLKLSKSVWPFFSTGEAPDLKDGIDRFFSMYRPASFCEDKTGVYKKKDEECDAIKA